MQGVQQYVLERDRQKQQDAANIASNFRKTGELSSADAKKLIYQGVSPEQIMQMQRDTSDIRMNAKLEQYHRENPHIRAEKEAHKRLVEANNARERNEYLNRQRQAAAQRQAAEAQRQAQAQIQAFKEYNSPANGFKRAFGNLGSDIKRGVGNSFQAPWKAVGRGVGNGIIRNLPEAPTSELK